MKLGSCFRRTTFTVLMKHHIVEFMIQRHELYQTVATETCQLDKFITSTNYS